MVIMKRAVVLTAVIGLLSFAANARDGYGHGRVVVPNSTPSAPSTRGYYGEVGLGVGQGFTTIGGRDAVSGSGITELAVDLISKAGFSLSPDMSLYGTIEISGMGHRFDDGDDYVQYNSYLIGPGIIYYIAPRLQLAGSLGYSFTGNTTSMPFIRMDNGTGIAWSVSAGYEVGPRFHRMLVGARYFSAHNKLERTNQTMNSSAISIFVRYVFHRNLRFFDDF